MYQWRHLIENHFAKLKEFRAVASRYDKTNDSFRATINLAAAIIASRWTSTDPSVTGLGWSTLLSVGPVAGVALLSGVGAAAAT
jgi:hypothetical protein